MSPRDLDLWLGVPGDRPCVTPLKSLLGKGGNRGVLCADAPGVGFSLQALERPDVNLILPEFRVLRKLGRGANSELFCVQNIQNGELRTAKFVKLSDNEEEERKFIEQLRAEQTTGQALDHPVLRKIYDLRYVRKRLRIRAAVLMMEYVDGVPMSSSALRPGLVQMLSYFKLAAEGLHAMHTCGFVHADLKPGNLLITPDNEVKLIDFGQSSAMLQAKDRIQGTPDYMAPEQAKRSVLNQRTDVFDNACRSIAVANNVAQCIAYFVNVGLLAIEQSFCRLSISDDGEQRLIHFVGDGSGHFAHAGGPIDSSQLT